MDSESECDDGFYDHRVPTAESDLSGPEEFDYETERDCKCQLLHGEMRTLVASSTVKQPLID
jgi:hypothetical protein